MAKAVARTGQDNSSGRGGVRSTPAVAPKVSNAAGYCATFGTTPVEVIERTREGLAITFFLDMVKELDIGQTQLMQALGLNRSTITSRIRNNQPLSATEGDKVYRVAKVMDRAIEVLGDDDLAKRWLQNRHRSIGGVQPISLLDTEAGYELVMDTLGRIEQGIPA